MGWNLQVTTEKQLAFVAPSIDEPIVVGASSQGVYVAGKVKLGEQAMTEGARRWVAQDWHPVLVLYALDGRELKRWLDVRADRVVDDIALALEDQPCAIRLADGETLYTFSQIERHDHELVWGYTAKSWNESTMSSQVRKISGEVVLDLDNVWVDELWWDKDRIYIRSEKMAQTFDRNGQLLRGDVPAHGETVTIETEAETQTLDESAAPWHLGYWTHIVGGGWQAHWKSKQLLVAPFEPNATWVAIELSRVPADVQLAPPWIAFQREDMPILLLALAELVTARAIKVDGKWFARRIVGDPRPKAPEALVAWYEKLAAAGITPENRDRDAHLLRVFDGETAPKPSSLALAMSGFSPFCVEHDTHYLYSDDVFYVQLSEALGITVEEVARTAQPRATIRMRTHNRSIEFQCEPIVSEIVSFVDGNLARLGSDRRLYALAQYQEDMFAYLVITPAQREQLVAAGIRGIHPSSEMPFDDEALDDDE